MPLTRFYQVLRKKLLIWMNAQYYNYPSSDKKINFLLRPNNLRSKTIFLAYAKIQNVKRSQTYYLKRERERKEKDWKRKKRREKRKRETVKRKIEKERKKNRKRDNGK